MQARLELMALGKIQGATRNPKLHDLDGIQQSIRRFGFVDFPTLNERTGRLVEGHGRTQGVKLIKRAGPMDGDIAWPPTNIVAKGRSWYVPVVRGMSWETDAEAAAYLAAHNQLTMSAGWDERGLADLLMEVKTTDAGFDGLGFESDFIEGVFAGVHADPLAVNGPDIAPPPPPPSPPPPTADPSLDETPDDIPAISKPNEAIRMGRHTLMVADCLKAMREMPANSMDSIVTDPPYGIGFMGKGWDASVPGAEWAAECLRVLKPGGHIIAFAANRTIHRLAVSLEDAGFEIRDQIGWLTWQGFPKSHAVDRAIDKQRDDRDDVLKVTAWIREQRDAAGISNADIDAAFGLTGMAGHWTTKASQPATPTAEQLPVLLGLFGMTMADLPADISQLFWTLDGNKGQPGPDWTNRPLVKRMRSPKSAAQRAVPILPSAPDWAVTSAASAKSAQWTGWGTALKPANEPAILARKPLIGTVAENVLAHGVGGLNIDGCRYAPGDPAWPGPNGDVPDVVQWQSDRQGEVYGADQRDQREFSGHPGGRWPANVYMCPKPARSEREAGTTQRGNAVMEMRTEGSAGTRSPRAGAGRTGGLRGNFHATVKPVQLMRWLCRLVTPPGGTILEPFLGSGTTAIAAECEGFTLIGCELEPKYMDISRARLAHVQK